MAWEDVCVFVKIVARMSASSPPNNSATNKYMDSVSPEVRSRTMALVRAKDTKPEMVVRRVTHSLGFRYRLHDNRLLGVPDLVFPRLKKIIFVHGCFWHRHPGCAMARLPKSNLAFWLPKLNGNWERDQRNARLLRKEGWRVKVVWECQTKRPERMRRAIERFLNL